MANKTQVLKEKEKQLIFFPSLPAKVFVKAMNMYVVTVKPIYVISTC